MSDREALIRLLEYAQTEARRLQETNAAELLQLARQDLSRTRAAHSSEAPSDGKLQSGQVH